jgi:hypothetical protein
MAAAAALAPANSDAPATASGPLAGPIRATRKGVPEPEELEELELELVLAALAAEAFEDELDELPQAASARAITTARAADVANFFAPVDAA